MPYAVLLFVGIVIGVGLAAVVAGISVDYAIHVYIGTRLSQPPANLNQPGAAVKQIARPITYGALTTLGMFGAFFFSSIRGYHQMAVFSIISVLLALLIALMLLPHLLAGWGSRSAGRISRLGWLESDRISGKPAFFVWLALSALMAYFALGITLDTDVRAIDGTSKQIIQAEDRFFDTWGQSRLAVMVAQAQELDTVRELQDELYDDLSTELGPERVSSLSTLWPSARRMQSNRAAWEAFWSPQRATNLKQTLKSEGARYGYSPDAFAPFFGSLATKNLPAGLPPIKLTERYIRQLPAGGWQTSVFFPDEPASVSRMLKRIKDREDAYIVSGEALGQMISESMTSDMKKMTLMAGIAIVALASFFLRRPGLIAAALVPVVTSTLWLAGGVTALGLKLNVASLVAFIVVMGLSVDYGIFMAHRSVRPLAERRQAGTVLAVTLSAMSSLIGAGVLIFADHPALFSIGVTLVIGLSSGYLSAVFVSPYVAGVLNNADNTGGVG